jgi:hypothetical protein
MRYPYMTQADAAKVLGVSVETVSDGMHRE